MSNSPNLKLPFIDANQNQKSVTHNAALTILDALVNLQVQSNALNAPPSSPADGKCWIVASGGSGAWTGKDLNIAAWQDGAWNFYAPNRGFIAYVNNIGGALMWNGTAWVSLLNVISQLSLNALGIGTAADSGNPLSAKLNSALFTALPTTATPAGTGDLRLTLSKQAAGSTASFLFQDNFSGRAEIGLTGDDNFHFKVSPDGATFYDAIVITAAGGAVSFLTLPTAPTPSAGDNSTKLATTAWVAGKGYVTSTGAAAAAPVQSVAGRTGAVSLAVADVAGVAPLASPAFSGAPTTPNLSAGDASNKIPNANFVTSAVAAVTARTQVNDAAYTVLATDRTVAVVALTAARTLTLPAASAYPQGATLTVVDESGACSSTNTITIARAGTDTINGSTSAILSTAFGYVAIESNGSNKWTVIDQVPVAPRMLFAGNTGSVNDSSSGAGTFKSHGLNFTVPPNFLTAGRVLRVTTHFIWTTGTAPPTDLQIKILMGGTTVLLNDLGALTASLTARSFIFTYTVQATAAPSAASNVFVGLQGNANPSSATNTSSGAQPVALATNVSLAIDMQTMWSTAGTGPNTIQLLQMVVETLN